MSDYISQRLQFFLSCCQLLDRRLLGSYRPESGREGQLLAALLKLALTGRSPVTTSLIFHL
jgi:hypothetical protein